MREFFDELIENIIVLNKEKKIMFINKQLKEKIGYKAEENLSLEEINKLIKIDDKCVLIFSKENDVIKAEYSIKNLGLSNDEYYVVNVKWIGDKISQLINIEKFVDSLEECVCIKDLDKNYIFVNKRCADLLNVSKEKARKIIELEDLNSKIGDIILKNDEYIKRNKNASMNEVIINKNGINKNYDIIGYPIFDDERKEVQFIANILKDQTFIKNVQLQTIKSLKILEHNNRYGMDIEEYKENLFKGLKGIFKDYFKTNWFNIWEYNKEEKLISPYFLNNKIKEVLTENKCIYISDKDINDYIEGKYKEIIYVNPNDIFKVNKNDLNNYYVVTQPIIYDGEFIGLISINYESYPILKTINKDLIKYLSNQVGFIVKHIRFLKILNEEINNKENIARELEEFINVATEVIVKVNKKNDIVSISTGFIDIFKWSKEEVLNMKWMDMVHPDDLSDSLSFVDQFKKKPNERVSFVNRVRCRDGSYKWIQWVKGIYKDEEKYILASGRDITREKELELKESLIEKSIELERVRTEFFANLSHELKTPLTLIMAVVQVIENYVDEFEDKNKKDNFKRYLNVLKQNSYRLLRLVTNLIDVTRIDAGFYQLNPQNNNIVEVVEDIVMSVVTYCEGKNINLTFNTETEEEVISCDADQIERVILNILSNAIKFTNSDGNIYIDISLEEKNVVIKIEDSGIGISKENLKFIFDRFIQIDNLMTRKCEGSGIGLSLVKSIIELHNGSITVESIEGLGSTFIVSLPRKKMFVDEIYADNKIDDVDSKLEKCSIEFSDIYNL